MCLILHKPAGVEFPEDKLEVAFENNRDGLGIMYHDNDKVIVHRSLPQNFDEVLKVWRPHKEKELALHFRFATSGNKDKHNCHPFKILHHDRDGRDLYLMHNGVIYGLDEHTKTYSDTWHFVNDYVRPFVLKYGVEVLKDPFFQSCLEDFIGSGNKLLLLDSSGEYNFINRDKGSNTEVKDCWVSNTYSFRSSYRTNKTANTNTTTTSYYGAGWNTVKPQTVYESAKKETPSTELSAWYGEIPSEERIHFMNWTELLHLIDSFELDISPEIHSLVSLREAVCEGMYFKYTDKNKAPQDQGNVVPFEKDKLKPDYWVEGWDAYFAGKPRHLNPYSTSYAANRWYEGWDGADEYQKQLDAKELEKSVEKVDFGPFDFLETSVYGSQEAIKLLYAKPKEILQWVLKEPEGAADMLYDFMLVADDWIFENEEEESEDE